MHRLGYTRYVGQGGDVGASVTKLVTTLGGAPRAMLRRRSANVTART
jgi:hypothetical protein